MVREARDMGEGMDKQYLHLSLSFTIHLVQFSSVHSLSHAWLFATP